MVLHIKFIGALRHVSGKTRLTAAYKTGMSLKDLLVEIQCFSSSVGKPIGDSQSNSSVENALILVNGREISVLDGLETKISDGDEIVFVPVIHGG